MRAFGRILLAVMCTVCLWTEARVQAKAAGEPLSFYEDGDVVGFIGDSITHVDYNRLGYVEILDLYYRSRLPQRNVEFRNLGTNGFKAVDVLEFYDRDPAYKGINKAVILLGTNDAILGFSPEKYIDSMKRLVDKLKEEGLEGGDIIILSPPFYDKGYNPRWNIEDDILVYINELEVRTEEWGVHYIDLYTPMAELTEEIRGENAGNTLTKDGIHPNATGQMLIACCILQAQGAGGEPLSEIRIPAEGEPQTIREDIENLHRGTKGMTWDMRSEILPAAALDGINSVGGAEALWQKSIQIEGLLADAFYELRMDGATLGSFSGRELSEGVHLATLEDHPQQTMVEQVAALGRERHKEVVKYRKIWSDLALKKASYTPGQIQGKYEKWKAADERLRDEMCALAEGMAGEVCHMTILEMGCTEEELNQEIEAAKQAAREAEEARKAQEQAAEEAGKAQEQAAKEAEEARRAQEQAEKEAQEQAAREAEAVRRRIWFYVGAGMLAVLAAMLVCARKKLAAVAALISGGSAEECQGQ